MFLLPFSSGTHKTREPLHILDARAFIYAIIPTLPSITPLQPIRPQVRQSLKFGYDSRTINTGS